MRASFQPRLAFPSGGFSGLSTFFVCLTGCLATFAVCGAFSFEADTFGRNAALYDFSILGASWTFAVEFLAVPFILAGYWSYRRFGVMGIACTYAVFATILCAPWMREHFVYYQRFLSCFALGLLIPTGFGAGVARLMPVMAWIPVLLAMLASRHVMGLHWCRWTRSRFLRRFLSCSCSTGGGSLGRFFDRGISQYLGRISYSLYLFNIIFSHSGRALDPGSRHGQAPSARVGPSIGDPGDSREPS